MKSELVGLELTPCNDWLEMIQAQKHTAADHPGNGGVLPDFNGSQWPHWQVHVLH